MFLYMYKLYFSISVFYIPPLENNLLFIWKFVKIVVILRRFFRMGIPCSFYANY